MLRYLPEGTLAKQLAFKPRQAVVKLTQPSYPLTRVEVEEMLDDVFRAMGLSPDEVERRLDEQRQPPTK